MNIYIIYRNFLNADKKTVSIGGIQTYILNLIDVIKSLNCIPVICQIGKERYSVKYQGTMVHAYNTTELELSKNVINDLHLINEPIIFGTHELIVDYKGPSIAIHHGITWDVPVHQELNKKLNILYVFQRARMAYKTVKQISKTKCLVCVDYNFVNWYRTQVAYPSTHMSVIPNFAIPQDNVIKPTDRINLLFARRLFWYRGTRLFYDIMGELLEKNLNLYITIAGEGEDEEMFKQKYSSHPRVELIHYKSEDSYKIHRDKHIAIVPTIGSEGTSLSLLEAMASKCAVVCSNVGGMSNIVINGFNGRMINPDKIELRNAIQQLIDTPQMCSFLSENAFRTVQGAFSLNVWKSYWKEVIEKEFFTTENI